MKAKLKPKFVTDEKGKKTSVIIDLKDYRNLLEYLEDLEDAYDLLDAERKAKGFVPYHDFRKRMVANRKS